MKRRAIRIVPLYWLATTGMLIKAGIMAMHPELAHGAGHSALSVPYIAASYLFIPYRDTLGQVLPLLSVGWTLSFEMLFYACFAAAIWLRMSAIRLLAPLFALFIIGGLAFTSSAIMTLASPLLFEFIAGLWLGNLAKSGKCINRTFAVAAGAVGLVILLTVPLPSPAARAFTWGAGAFLVVLSAIGLERGLRLPAWLQKLGESSYSLYLVHIPIFSICYRLLRGAFNTPHGAYLIVATCLVLSLGGAVLVHRFVEIPLTTAARGWVTPAAFSAAPPDSHSTIASFPYAA